ncbi:MAG: pyruvate dehydrogenase (acetyl-transferring), homodimeric type [Candidatus Omnitrophica bacterium]|nr:pyruvate dehydrogenase (acetyl-transferring), homodimeric type [Candidatus Omnitrophota bacterium]
MPDEELPLIPVNQEELHDWMDSLDYVLKNETPEQVQYILQQLQIRAQENGITAPFTYNTPYINTIPLNKQPPFPGDRIMERQIKNIIRWNAMAMVIRANKHEAGIGGHISSFASAATLYEIAFNHFIHGKQENGCGDMVYIQGHSSPGIYARAFLEGRLSQEQLENFRRELAKGGGLSSYPHPWLMPSFWEFPTVSMGLGPIMAIYQARFNKYLENRGLKKPGNEKVWAFLGDGEVDEPESLGAITLASREKLDNLIFVINCNLQRLDGPVRGNGKIIQELEANFRGAGWNVIKVIWGADWDPLLEKDTQGLLARRMAEIVDGEYQKYVVESGKYIREHFFGKDPRLLAMVAHLNDQQLETMRRGGHDPEKVYAAFKAASEFKGAPTVVLAKTIKGYGLGESGEGKNITHQQKKLNLEELQEFRSRFSVPVPDNAIEDAPFYRPADDSPEIRYLKECRRKLGGPSPSRREKTVPLPVPGDEVFEEFYKGTEGREVSTTMAYVRILSKLLQNIHIGKYIVPIIPDEARTFGMETFFRQFGIYASTGQLYEPVDSESLIYYKESKNGQILEEGINEAGSMSSFIAAGTAYSTHNIPMIPFYTYYSMFGPQRIGDLIWASADLRCRGFLVGATSGRTTLNGEGLQHQDGHSHILLSTVPTLKSYDPAFAYEIAVIIKEGLKRMYTDQDSCSYYLSVSNENYAQPVMPENVFEGIIKGAYLFKRSERQSPLVANLLGSGSIMNQVLAAQKILEEKFNVTANVYSVTSYNELRREALTIERDNMLKPFADQRNPYITTLLEKTPGVVVAASDYMKALPDSIRPWVPASMLTLGTDGFGRSESREALRDFFEVDAKHIVWAALVLLYRAKTISGTLLSDALQELGINPEKANPMTS